MPQPIDVPDIEARPLVDERGFAILFDLYVAGKWIGSKRTVEQCEQRLSFVCGVPIHATGGRAW